MYVYFKSYIDKVKVDPILLFFIIISPFLPCLPFAAPFFFPLFQFRIPEDVSLARKPNVVCEIFASPAQTTNLTSPIFNWIVGDK
jgi:hypothetical protein